MYCVDIDTGGTMTDTLVSGGESPLLIKVESTPHDITESFRQSLEQAAEQLDYQNLKDFLDQVRFIRWTSTLTSNVLAQGKGPKLGLIVSPGAEENLYTSDIADAKAVIPRLVRLEHIVALSEHADRIEIVGTVKRLIDQGIRRINISFKGAFPSGEREQEVLKIIDEQFPDHFLGSVPALAGSEMLLQPDDMSRTFYALINAYVHNALANSLFKAEDYLKAEMGWRGDILVGHLSGGVARIGKTKAVDTIESGPLFGTHASAYVAKQEKCSHVIAIDIGGTTGKVSVITDGNIETKLNGSIFGIPVRMPMPVLRSNALGGGSIAHMEAGEIRLGPESMGAAPGPACYGLGGGKATLTDALVLLGIISPTTFLGGRRTLDLALAKRAVSETIAEPLNIPIDEAAQGIVVCATKMMAELANEAIAETSWSNRKEVELFAYGGNGPLFGTQIADILNIEKVRFFAYGTVFSAYGSAISDVLHVYESAIMAPVSESSVLRSGEVLYGQAVRDLEGEGFDVAHSSFCWRLSSAAEQSDLVDGAVNDVLPILYSEINQPSMLRLEARYVVGKVELTSHKKVDSFQPLFLEGRSSDIDIYAHHDCYGQRIIGPSLVDGGTFTWFISAGWTLDVDSKGNALAHKGLIA
jgi:N-methylhydantoinase A/oxoprolinase/acetone carboxylase beta subunit